MNIEKIRVSIGSASILGLESISFKNKNDKPTTCYVMTFRQGHCMANCGFCPQSRDSASSTKNLSRISWPVYPFKKFITKLRNLPPLKKFKRICIQTLNYPENFHDLVEIITNIKNATNTPLSVAIPPMSNDKLKYLKSIGVQRVGIALDGATPEIFDQIKGKGVDGPYDWNIHLQCLKNALEIFPKDSVTTHIIVGMGETEKDIIEQIQKLKDLKILVSLFAFTPIKGTKLQNWDQPDVIKFRKMQLGRYLILSGNKQLKDFTFNLEGDLIQFNINKKDLGDIIENSTSFLTSGCPGCNRPYYTSKPSSTMYNYPRKLNDDEKKEVYNSLKNYVI